MVGKNYKVLEILFIKGNSIGQVNYSVLFVLSNKIKHFSDF